MKASSSILGDIAIALFFIAACDRCRFLVLLLFKSHHKSQSGHRSNSVVLCCRFAAAAVNPTLIRVKFIATFAVRRAKHCKLATLDNSGRSHIADIFEATVAVRMYVVGGQNRYERFTSGYHNRCFCCGHVRIEFGCALCSSVEHILHTAMQSWLAVFSDLTLPWLEVSLDYDTLLLT